MRKSEYLYWWDKSKRSIEIVQSTAVEVANDDFRNSGRVKALLEQLQETIKWHDEIAEDLRSDEE